MTPPELITEPAQPSVLSLRPVDDSERIVPLDVLGGVALLGIPLMNIQSFSMIGAAYAITGISDMWLTGFVIHEWRYGKFGPRLQHMSD
jgi:uncharacterized membrane protein YeiB